MSEELGFGTVIQALVAMSKAWNIRILFLKSCSRTGIGQSAMQPNQKYLDTSTTWLIDLT